MSATSTVQCMQQALNRGDTQAAKALATYLRKKLDGGEPYPRLFSIAYVDALIQLIGKRV
jgi:hypothetical protein